MARQKLKQNMLKPKKEDKNAIKILQKVMCQNLVENKNKAKNLKQKAVKKSLCEQKPKKGPRIFKEMDGLMGQKKVKKNFDKIELFQKI